MNVSFIEYLENIGNGTLLLDSFENINEIYHYTNISCFKGILETNNFWVSHSYFMNDISEIKYTYQLIIDELEKFKELESNPNIKGMFDLLKLGMHEAMKKETEESYRIYRGKNYRPIHSITSNFW